VCEHVCLSGQGHLRGRVLGLTDVGAKTEAEEKVGLRAGEFGAAGAGEIDGGAVKDDGAKCRLIQDGVDPNLFGEQTRPYVAVCLEVLREVEMSMLQLVFKNFGTTTARDITVSVDQPMRRAWGRASSPEEIKLFDRLPALVPGQTWETLFDWGPDRFKAGLNEAYEITVHSHDSAASHCRMRRS